jgi:CMP/dCMP kinase
MIVLLNGSAASGKGTLARMLANALQLPHYDFGLLFRAVAYVRQTYSWPETRDLIETELLRLNDGVQLHGGDITATLRSEAIGLLAARTAAADEGTLVDAAKLFVRHTNFVADGRTVSQVYPHASIHFFVFADQSVARSRRVAEGQEGPLFDERWRLDQSRICAAAGSISIDTTNRTPDEILPDLLRHVFDRRESSVTNR